MNRPLRIELLGPLRIVWQGRTVAPGPHRQQALLAVLALRVNQVCTPEELLDLVWHDNPPGTGLKVLPPYIYRLRRTLPAEVLDRTPDGYVLRLPEDALDTTAFETAVQAAGRHRESGDLDAAAGAYQQALALFRGEPLSGLPGQYLAAQRLRLTERRDKVFADRVDVDLDRGRHAELIAELAPAVAAKPFDEHLAGQLMLALSADGRQADALDVYARAREILVDQLGVEPGPALRDLHQTILRNESPLRTRDELPYAGSTFVGRSTELGRLVAALGNSTAAAPPIVAIDGMAGVGKTALAVNTARQLAARYPDGLLFVDLHGHTPGRAPLDTKAALDHLLVGVGLPGLTIPHTLEEARTLWRTTVAGRRLLVVLDNAPDSTTVEPLLPGSPTCGVLITSRNQLTGLDVRERLHLELLAAADASALLAQLVGADRAAADVAASNGLIERCGNLPLALRIAGARLRHRPSWTVAHINQRLDRVGRRLTELTADGLGIAAAFQLSYAQLSPEQQRAFRLLSLLPGRDLDQYGAAALTDRTPDDAADLAESLVDANLLLQPAPGRYQFHDLIRDYAAELARTTDSAADLDAAGNRLLEYYLQACSHPLLQQASPDFLELGDRPAVAVPTLATIRESNLWAGAEATNLVAAVEQAATDDRLQYVWMLALGCSVLLQQRGKIQQHTTVLELASAATEQLGDRSAEARILHATARLVRGQHGARAAVDVLHRALERLPGDGDPRVRSQLYSTLGICLQTIDPYGEALPTLQRASDIARELNDDRLLARALVFTGIAHGNSRDYDAAVRAYQEALTLLRRHGPSGLMADALSGLTTCYLGLDRLDDAVGTATEAHRTAAELDSVFSLPYALAQLGRVHRLRGNLDKAVDLQRQALAAADKIGQLPSQWTIRLALGETLLAMGDTDGARHSFELVASGASGDKDHLYLVSALEGLADHALATGQAAQAVDYLEQAVALTDEFAPPRSPIIRNRLAELNGRAEESH
ncbi:tetratricopeptide repeat protein [Kribbella turkmenica]|uniref:Tetratricopeptide repeat protein n=1 Tax=Kribbella turkmenica TaxID=2530375 RepID=A0A4R4XC91_9ACTN|nr:BTAD domain-containing putative transcriptional regulator [Kribbella turkmenica]TDD28184.1 tetratricopeptide repeat protein [Kribbella turkmenica]